jgi:hypothetical protein
LVEVREVMRLIHWLLALPEAEELGFRRDVSVMEASMQTKRRSTYERIVWEEGLEAGREQGRHDAVREFLLDQVAERFGPCTEVLRARVEAIQDEAQLRQLGRAILKDSKLGEFESRLGTIPAGQA